MFQRHVAGMQLHFVPSFFFISWKMLFYFFLFLIYINMVLLFDFQETKLSVHIMIYQRKPLSPFPPLHHPHCRLQTPHKSRSIKALYIVDQKQNINSIKTLYWRKMLMFSSNSSFVFYQNFSIVACIFFCLQQICLFFGIMTAASFWGLVALRLADDEILPFDYVSYASELKVFSCDNISFFSPVRSID